MVHLDRHRQLRAIGASDRLADRDDRQQAAVAALDVQSETGERRPRDAGDIERVGWHVGLREQRGRIPVAVCGLDHPLLEAGEVSMVRCPHRGEGFTGRIEDRERSVQLGPDRWVSLVGERDAELVVAIDRRRQCPDVSGIRLRSRFLDSMVEPADVELGCHRVGARALRQVVLEVRTSGPCGYVDRAWLTQGDVLHQRPGAGSGPKSRLQSLPVQSASSR